MDLKEVLVGPLARLRYVKRYSTIRVTLPESTSEHSYFTAIYCLILASYLDPEEVRFNRSDLLTRALLHDVEESVTGDLPRPFKHSDAELILQVERLGRKSILEIFQKIFESKGPGLPDLYATRWCHAKDGTCEGRLLAFADFLSVLSFVAQEVQGGNTVILNQLQGLKAYHRIFEGQGFEFLGSLPAQAKEFMKKEIYEYARQR